MDNRAKLRALYDQYINHPGSPGANYVDFLDAVIDLLDCDALTAHDETEFLFSSDNC